MEQLESIADIDDFEFNFYNNEMLEDSILVNLNDRLTERSKPNVISGDGFCKYFCGTECKYCKPMTKFSQDKMALDGLYSTWITNNILAIARPSNEYIDKFDIINQFKKHDIKTIINMQMSGEHGYCGYPLHSSGFSYDPDKFMEHGIDHLNYPCDDYGAPPVSYLFDIVKTIQHRLAVGKIAIHCHAGHGRTGMVIACYLIFSNRISEIRAINYVRKKRPGSIQNRLQVDTVIEFAKYLEPWRTIFWMRSQTKPKFSLQEAVMRQKKLVHGKEAYVLHYVPKIIFMCLRRVSKVDLDEEDSPFDFQDSKYPSECSLTAPVIIEDKENFVAHQHFQRWIQRIKTCFKKPLTKNHCESICEYLQTPYQDSEKLEELKESLNTNDATWEKLYQMDDIHVHCQLILNWFDDLKFPVLRNPDIEQLKILPHENMVSMFLKLESSVGKTLALVMEFLDQFQNLSYSKRWQLYGVLFSRLTHKSVNFLEDCEVNAIFEYTLNDRHLEIIRNLISIRMSQYKMA